MRVTSQVDSFLLSLNFLITTQVLFCLHEPKFSYPPPACLDAPSSTVAAAVPANLLVLR